MWLGFVVRPLWRLLLLLLLLPVPSKSGCKFTLQLLRVLSSHV
jgi:hypothetical protein